MPHRRVDEVRHADDVRRAAERGLGHGTGDGRPFGPSGHQQQGKGPLYAQAIGLAPTGGEEFRPP